MVGKASWAKSSISQGRDIMFEGTLWRIYDGSKVFKRKGQMDPNY